MANNNLDDLNFCRVRYLTKSGDRGGVKVGIKFTAAVAMSHNPILRVDLQSEVF